ncbi:HalOD1 output domain-containing protein [Halobacterium wangiae]|uniref:HalOD1 output domain-containing protein n=1 Tax=Halobacterium wangiae TaxID=2902623 RepID=UPI001E2BAD61|nr:HalOD1 output domain-containing protein [Halobacterium wangiae]
MEYNIGVDESVSTAVVRAVSAVNGRRPGSLRSLDHVLDPEALDALFVPAADGKTRIGGRLSFVFGNCRVTVDNGEYLTVRPLTIPSRVPDFQENR